MRPKSFTVSKIEVPREARTVTSLKKLLHTPCVVVLALILLGSCSDNAEQTRPGNRELTSLRKRLLGACKRGQKFATVADGNALRQKVIAVLS